jgi:hypothetical protein
MSGARADGQTKWDVGLTKGFRLAERALFRLRAQCFNLMNHPSFGVPNLSPTSTAFGQITATASLPRSFHVAGTITF